MSLKSKLKKALGNQPFETQQHCVTCNKTTTMTANYQKEEVVCNNCNTKHVIDEKSLDPIVKQLKQLGVF